MQICAPLSGYRADQASLLNDEAKEGFHGGNSRARETFHYQHRLYNLFAASRA